MGNFTNHPGRLREASTPVGKPRQFAERKRGTHPTRRCFLPRVAPIHRDIDHSRKWLVGQREGDEVIFVNTRFFMLWPAQQHVQL